MVALWEGEEEEEEEKRQQQASSSKQSSSSSSKQESKQQQQAEQQQQQAEQQRPPALCDDKVDFPPGFEKFQANQGDDDDDYQGVRRVVNDTLACHLSRDENQ